MKCILFRFEIDTVFILFIYYRTYCLKVASDRTDTAESKGGFSP